MKTEKEKLISLIEQKIKELEDRIRNFYTDTSRVCKIIEEWKQELLEEIRK